MQTWLHIEPHGVTFARLPDGKREVQLQIATWTRLGAGGHGNVVVRGENAVLTSEQYANALKEGLYYRFWTSAYVAGIYQVSVAVRDVTSGATGSAIEMVQRKDHTAGRISISSMLLSPASDAAMSIDNQQGFWVDRSKAGLPVRPLFHSGESIDCLAWVMNASKDSKLSIEHMVFYGRTMRAHTAPKQVETYGANPGPIPYRSRLKLDQALKPGFYTILIHVQDEKTGISADQWVEFELAAVTK